MPPHHFGAPQPNGFRVPPAQDGGGGGLGGNWGASFRGLQGKWGAHLVFWRGWKMSFHCFRGAVGKLGCPPFNFGIHQNGFGVTKAQGQWQKLGCSFWGEALEKLGYPFCILRCWGVPPFFRGAVEKLGCLCHLRGALEKLGHPSTILGNAKGKLGCSPPFWERLWSAAIIWGAAGNLGCPPHYFRTLKWPQVTPTQGGNKFSLGFGGLCKK